MRVLVSLFSLFFALLLLGVFSKDALANCNTFFSRVAKQEAENFVTQNQTTICSHLRHLDKTKDFKLRHFELCEENGRVAVEAKVYVRCATSSKALFPTSASETIKAEIVANLNSCQIEHARIKAAGFFAKIGIQAANLEGQLRQKAAEALRGFCHQRQTN